MVITFEQVAFVIGTLVSLATWSWWLVSRATRAETEIKAGIAAISAKQDAQHAVAELKMTHMTERVARVEKALDGITKVVVFQEGKTT